jgi:hypothetical protein
MASRCTERRSRLQPPEEGRREPGPARFVLINGAMTHKLLLIARLAGDLAINLLV